MLKSKNITKISSLKGIEYEDYLRFKSTLPETLTSHEQLQVRWIMTQASYFTAQATIFIACDDPAKTELIKQALHFVNTDLSLNGKRDEFFDMAIIFDKESKNDYYNTFENVKPNGFLILGDNIDFETELSTLEICGLKIYQKPIQKEDVGFNIHIFIPVHNGIKQTLRCLHSIYTQTIIDVLKITVIDDGSSDGTTQKIEEQFPDVSVLTGDGTLWWTGAINKALQSEQHLFKEDDYFLLINSDVTLGPNTIFFLLKNAIKDRSLCLAPLGFTQDEAIACGEADDGHIFYRFERSSQVMLQNDNIYPVMSLFGRCTLLPIEILEKVGEFDAVAFPHYYGDTDFCLRAKEFGYKFMISGKTAVSVRHDSNSTGTHHSFFSKKRSLREIYNYLTDIKSLGNIKYLWRFYARHYPKQKYKVLVNTLIKSIKQY